MRAQDELETAMRLLHLALTVFPDHLSDGTREIWEYNRESCWKELSDKAQKEVKQVRSTITRFLNSDAREVARQVVKIL